MDLPDDVVQYVQRAFAPAAQAPALAQLAAAVDEAGRPVGPRLLRCAAVAARGDTERLDYYVNLLQIDWRDVIVAGEYWPVEGRLTRVRNLAEPIGQGEFGPPGLLAE